MTQIMVGLFNLGGGEIILILALLSVSLVALAVILGAIILIVRMTRKNGSCEPVPSVPPTQRS